MAKGLGYDYDYDGVVVMKKNGDGIRYRCNS
jgi:hypothetical protein